MKEKPEVEFEVICVNDCSLDEVLQVLVEMIKERSYLKVTDFMRNFGKDSVIMAGLSVIDGGIAIVLDDDYQCHTYEVWRLIEPILNGESDISTAQYEVKM
ncbi:MAG: glycosyltransferase [Lachnospiraceae bacterium]|nr:glycosyltransferase [Lachnospiraceae bacterium]